MLGRHSEFSDEEAEVLPAAQAAYKETVRYVYKDNMLHVREEDKDDVAGHARKSDDVEHFHVRHLIHQPPRAIDRDDFCSSENGRISKLVSIEPWQEEVEDVVLKSEPSEVQSYQEAK